MSQAKVDRYKEEKKNRKKTMAKEKRLHLLAVVCGWLVVIALAGWAGVSGYFSAILPFFYVRSFTLPSLRRRVPPSPVHSQSRSTIPLTYTGNPHCM